MKDDINARKDLVEMGVCLEIQPQRYGKQTYFPLACHTLSNFEKISFCRCLRELKYHKDTLQILRTLCQRKI